MYYLDVLRHRTLEQISGSWNNATRQSLDTGDAILSVDASSCFRWKPDAMHHSVDQSHKTCQRNIQLITAKIYRSKTRNNITSNIYYQTENKDIAHCDF